MELCILMVVQGITKSLSDRQQGVDAVRSVCLQIHSHWTCLVILQQLFLLSLVEEVLVVSFNMRKYHHCPEEAMLMCLQVHPNFSPPFLGATIQMDVMMHKWMVGAVEVEAMGTLEVLQVLMAACMV
jgi:hypothetical protein